MTNDQFLKATLITPAFPNWEKSFVSGPNSNLYQVEHRLQADPLALISHVKFKNGTEGPPGHVHGGATAGLIDEVMGILVWNQKYPSVTQSLTLKYLRPVPLTIDGYLVTTLTSVNERTVEVACAIVNGDNDAKEKTPYVQAVGVFHRLTQEQMDRFLK